MLYFRADGMYATNDSSYNGAPYHGSNSTGHTISNSASNSSTNTTTNTATNSSPIHAGTNFPSITSPSWRSVQLCHRG